MTVEELKHALKNYNKMIVWQKANETSLIAMALYSEGMKETKERLIASNRYYQNMINEVHNFIEWLPEPTQSMVVDKYIKEISDVYLELDYHYSCRHLLRIVEQNIDEYLEEIKMSEAT